MTTSALGRIAALGGQIRLRAAAVKNGQGVAHLGERAHEVGTNEAGPANNQNPHTTRLLQPEVTQARRGCAVHVQKRKSPPRLERGGLGNAA